MKVLTKIGTYKKKRQRQQNHSGFNLIFRFKISYKERKAAFSNVYYKGWSLDLQNLNSQRKLDIFSRISTAYVKLLFISDLTSKIGSFSSFTCKYNLIKETAENKQKAFQKPLHFKKKTNFLVFYSIYDIKFPGVDDFFFLFLGSLEQLRKKKFLFP